MQEEEEEEEREERRRKDFVLRNFCKLKTPSFGERKKKNMKWI
jgi:hypothetical protein